MLIDIPTRLKNIEKPIRRITAKEAALEIEKNQGLLLDVREASEVAEKPVNKATAIPRGILEMKMLALVKEADRPIYIHCASGVRFGGRTTYAYGLRASFSSHLCGGRYYCSSNRLTLTKASFNMV